MNKAKLFSLMTVLVFLVLSVTVTVNVSAVSAKETAPASIAEEMVNSSGIGWLMKVDYQRLRLTLVRPDGSFTRKTYTSDDSPYLNLSDIFGEGACDGHYNYELRVLAAESGQGVPMKENRARSVKSGTFEVRNGAVVTQSDPGELSRVQDYVHNDDVVITGDLCVGSGCSDNIVFGMNGILLKSTTPQIKFSDASGGPTSYSTWNITVNDSGSGYFAIEDKTYISTYDKILTLNAGAGANALYLDSNGRLGMGTSTPLEELHILADNNPAIILEDDNGPVWRMAVNEYSFFLAPSTSAYVVPFKIGHTAPNNTLVLKNSGAIGIGTNAPAYSMEIERTSANCSFGIDRTDGAKGKLVSGLYGFQVGSVTNHALKLAAYDTVQMTINTDGTLTMSDGGSYDGEWNNASSREIKDDITNLDSNEALKALEELTPVKYVYKKNRNEGRVGFIAEDVPELVATNSRKNLSTMDIVAVLTKVVKEQQKTISQLKEKVSDLEKRDNK